MKKSTQILHKGLSSVIVFVLCATVVVPFTTSAAYLSRQLELGVSGSDVSALQTFLAMDSSIYPQGLITGYFGVLTKAAVARYQTQNGISAVGRVGPQTLAFINNAMNNGTGINGVGYAPYIYPVNVAVSNGSATLAWNTNKPAAAIVYYSTSPLVLTEATTNTGITISGMQNLVHVTLLTSHTANLNNLQSNTTYYYLVYVRDGLGNETVTWPQTFTTN